ncbi:LOW QUALITY PROTEIN: rho GTPase-activating protein 28 [Aulostomus maculatus]
MLKQLIQRRLKRAPTVAALLNPFGLGISGFLFYVLRDPFPLNGLTEAATVSLHPLCPPLGTETIRGTMTSDSQHSTMETYWQEVQNIEEEEDGEEDEEAEERKSMDEVELEEAWLKKAGLSSLVGVSSEEVLPSAEALLSTLTRQQASTVRMRLDNYNQTLSRRSKQTIRDVRDIFRETNDDSPDESPTPLSHCTKSPNRYHTTTKTIRRNTTSVRPTLHTFVFEDQLPEDPQSPPPTHSLTPTPPLPGSQLRPDWLVRDCPYSEGVVEHKQGGACLDCLCSHGHDSSDLLGLTLVDDLSPGDLKQLGFICHIELTTFLVNLGVQIKRERPPPQRRSRDGGVFGVPLNTLLENDRKTFPGLKVPMVFQKLLCVLEQSGLQTEGILRVPGSAARLKLLRGELERCPEAFDWSTVRQVDAAGLLKLFIRELPTPLLTQTHMTTYYAVLGVSSALHQIQALQLLLLLLPESNRDTLKALLVLLHKVVSHQDQNRMSLWNVSMVMAPNLFACRRRSNKCSLAKQREEMEEALGGAHLVQLMITHQDLLWTVPSFLLFQVRRMNQVSNQKHLGVTRTKTRLLGRKNNKNQFTELSEGVIRVHAPLHTKVSMAIQLDRDTKAKDVISRFKCENSGPVQHLYEVGGNICERRLHPDCLLLEVYRINPHCDWLVKP